MTIEFAVLIGITAVCVTAAIVVALRRPGGLPRRGIAWTVVALVDLWLWQAAFAHAFGPQRWLVGPLAIVNAVAAFGAIAGLTGFRLHDDVANGTMGMFLGREGGMRANGFDDYRP